jgi:antitoxin VapB
MTERQVCAHMWEFYVAAGFEGNCMFVGADDRIVKYRHPVPTDRPVERAVLLAPAVSKWGLHALASRLVYFDQPPDDIRQRFRAVATMQAALVAATRPGVPLAQLLCSCLEMYDALGYPDEKTNHFHGGPTGYRVSYAERCQNPDAVVTENMAFGWYLTIAGVKSEELVLVDPKGAGIKSIDPTWPTLDIDIEGRTVAVADILVK